MTGFCDTFDRVAEEEGTEFVEISLQEWKRRAIMGEVMLLRQGHLWVGNLSHSIEEKNAYIYSVSWRVTSMLHKIPRLATVHLRIKSYVIIKMTRPHTTEGRTLEPDLV
ncbi:hypothetical protein HYC85_014526 [Camellia sinensis]|uniref:Uncharacterized protein n=1 Tax=Camellia sinensis TaxID=4442 RepID=A0A7J7H6S2_CAMSI|nr:hypothetical protein HYC85_014526 [Camellia sinensis]